MSPEEHRTQAETLLRNAWQKGGPDGETFIRTDSQRDAMIATAHVHAALATDGGTALLAKVRDYVGDHGDGEVDVWSLREVLAGRDPGASL